MAAIFILVTLASIAVYLLTISTGQVTAVTQDEQAARAYQAARAGAEWGAFQILRNPGGNFASSTNPGSKCSTGGTETVALGTLGAPVGANAFHAAVKCTRTTVSEGANNVRIYVLEVTGCNQTTCPGTPDANYVERQLQFVVAN
jgi:MSHA biogenesis protein MshP